MYPTVLKSNKPENSRAGERGKWRVSSNGKSGQNTTASPWLSRPVGAKSPNKYQKIIDAATSVFAQKGFHTAKISDIAKAAAVADGTIYLYFKSKDDLLISVFEYSIDLFIRTVEGAVRELGSPIDKLNCFIGIYFKLIKKYPELAQVIQLELRQSSKFMKEYTHTRFLAFLSIITGILEEGQRAGIFRPNFNPHIARRALFGAMDEIALEWLLMKKKKYSIEEATHELGAFFIDGLLLKEEAASQMAIGVLGLRPNELASEETASKRAPWQAPQNLIKESL